jgi:alpha-N-arabinofuranosidase
MGYTNPILPGFNPDPSVCRVGEDYYLVTSSFEFFPGVPIYHSRDLVHWEHIGYCLTRESQLPLRGCRSSGGIYAPSIRHHIGTFYMTTTNTTGGGNFLVSATNPAGPWSEPVWIRASGIDPSFFFDDDGKAYYLTSRDFKTGLPISLCEIDLETGALIGESTSIWQGTGGSYPEGPHLYKKDGWYFVMIAEGGTEASHMETIARSRDIRGPYEPCPRNPILTHRYRNTSVIHGTGHADMVEAHDGSWWIVFLAFRHAGYGLHHLGRETFIAPVTWEADGWPLVNGGDAIRLDMDVPTLPQVPLGPPRGPDRIDFDRPELDLSWNFVRTRSDVRHRIDTANRRLELWGNPLTLDDAATPAWIGRRQTDLDCTVSVRLDASGIGEGEEAGLTVFYNDNAHYEIFLRVRDGRRTVGVRRKVDDLCVISFEQPFEEAETTLLVVADRSRYWFGFGTDPEVALGNLVASGATRFVATEVHPGTFTGVYLGLYATGNGHDCAKPARFGSFSYDPFIRRNAGGRSIPYSDKTPLGTLLGDPRACEILDRRLPGLTGKIDRSSSALAGPLSPRLAMMLPGLTEADLRAAIEEISRL